MHVTGFHLIKAVSGIQRMAGGQGGRRKGAGRKPGSGWKAKVSNMRATSVSKMHKILASDNDPLSVVSGWVLDEGLDIQTRLSAASIALPYLYPRLSATTVDARHTVAHVDGSAIVQRLNERLERLLAEPVREIEAKPVQIEARPDEPEGEK